MEDYITLSAKTLDDAITEALVQLGVTSDRLDYIVVEKGSEGFLGIGRKQAVIKARRKQEEKPVEEVVKEEPKVEEPTPEEPKVEESKVEEPKVGDYAEFVFEGRAMRLYRMPSSSRAYPLALDKKAAAYRIMYQDLQMVI